jgi:hypothetical protein
MANMSRTRAGPTPTNISRNSDPDTEMKGTAASPAVALARRVLPVPGGPRFEKKLLSQIVNFSYFSIVMLRGLLKHF